MEMQRSAQEFEMESYKSAYQDWGGKETYLLTYLLHGAESFLRS
jgi:hypothetical protein